MLEAIDGHFVNGTFSVTEDGTLEGELTLERA